MPELPEVEVVRRGLAEHVTGRTIANVDVLHPRAVRRHGDGPGFAAAIRDRTMICVSRRGKYLWMPLDDGRALVAHLGMSGQLLIQPDDAPDERHLRVRIRFERQPQLRFIDQRTFGGLFVDELVPDDAGGQVPAGVAHIARDPLDPAFDDEAFIRSARASTSGIKRLLLDQSVISGIGNIYADESLWRTGIHGERPAARIAPARLRDLLGHARDVMSGALAAGGTSFDSLYVNVNGSSGYFSRSLDAYGREGEPCHRCGTAIRRQSFMNRSSYSCPRCQRTPGRVA